MKYLSLLCGLWFALMSGFFFAFSSTVMPAFGLLDGRLAMQSMQAINRAVANPFFAAGFWVALLLAIGGGALALAMRRPGWIQLLVGCLVYTAGSFVTTGARNVPLNRALEKVSAAAADSADFWQNWASDWTQWNHLRMGAAFLAAAIVLSNLLRREQLDQRS